MKKLKLTIAALAAALALPAAISAEGEPSVVATDVYLLKLTLKVPQVLDNSQSTGYRKYVTQTVKGEMLVKWLSDGTFTLGFDNLVNKDFKVSAAPVTYKGYEDRTVVYTRYNYIGSNKTDDFKTPCLCFYLELEPSYAIGGNNADNSFYLTLAGSGTSFTDKATGARIARKLSGYASGTQGCGCHAYSHKSPTRAATVQGPTGSVDDVVSTYGRWQATFRRRIAQ